MVQNLPFYIISSRISQPKGNLRFECKLAGQCTSEVGPVTSYNSLITRPAFR